MKILQLSASYKPAYIYGGPTMSISMLSEQLIIAGEGVTVYATTANGLSELPVEIAKPFLVDGVTVMYFERVTKDHTHLSPSLLTHLWRTARDYDVIHIHAWWNLVSVLGCLVALMRRVPVIVSPRGTLSSYSFHNKNNSIKSVMHSWLGKPLLKKCFIHTTSTNEYDAIKAILPDNTIFNIPNFINLTGEKFAGYQPTDHLRLIFFSRIEEKKGLDILLNALKSVTIPYKLTIAGDGSKAYVDQLKKLALDNGIADNMEWIGFQTDNKYQLLYEHDVLKAMLPHNAIFNIPNFINLTKNKFSGYQSTDHLRIIFFSRIEEKKGLDILLDALKSVIIPYKLTIAGDGNTEYVNQLKKMAFDNGIANNIDWIGFQTDNKYQLLYEHDVMVLPSYDENFGNVVIESLSVGTPVLISGQVGLADYIKDNKFGWVCETNPSSVSEAITNISSKKGTIDHIKQSAPAKISADFKYDKITAEYIGMYNQIIKK